MPESPRPGDSSPLSTTASPSGTLAAQMPSLSRIISVVMLIIGTLAVGALFYRVMATFFVPLFLAALLVVIFRPVHEWIWLRVGRRPRVAALLTTGAVLAVVLVPILVILIVAASQFTAMLQRMSSENFSSALHRGREKFSLTLPYAEHFRTLESLVESLDDVESSDAALLRISKAKQLIEFLQLNVDGPVQSRERATTAEEQLDDLYEAVRDAQDPQEPQNLADELAPEWLETEERLDRHAARATTAVRRWMDALLGGPVWSQVRLAANPDQDRLNGLAVWARQTLQPRFVQVTSATGGVLVETLIGLLIMIISVYFFLLDGPGMIQTLMRLSPLDDAYERRLLIQFDRTSRAVVLASTLSAVTQGVLAAIAYSVLGFPSVVFLFLITTLLALVPFLGAASVWVPCVIWLAAVDDRWTAAIGLAIYGTLVISSIDNVIKVFILHGRSQLHPLLALLSVLGGVAVFGPIGILVGPMVVVFLQTLLEILNSELVRVDTVPQATPESTGPTE